MASVTKSSLMAFQFWSGVSFGQLDILSLWSVMEISMLKNTSAFWTKGLMVESHHHHYSTLFMQDRAPCHTAKKAKDWLAKERIKCLPWPNQHGQKSPKRSLPN